MYTIRMVKDVFDWRRIKRIMGKITLCLLILVTVSIVSMRKQAQIDSERYGAEIAEIRAYYDAEIIKLETRVEYGGEVSEIEEEAEYIAKVLYGTALNNSEDGQRAVVWCIINRVESTLYPDTVKDVCRQDQQWMGYSDDNPVMEELYNVALGELKIWHNDGHRPVNPSFIYLSWSANEIELRDSFERKPGTHYWKVG